MLFTNNEKWSARKKAKKIQIGNKTIRQVRHTSKHRGRHTDELIQNNLIFLIREDDITAINS